MTPNLQTQHMMGRSPSFPLISPYQSQAVFLGFIPVSSRFQQKHICDVGGNSVYRPHHQFLGHIWDFWLTLGRPHYHTIFLSIFLNFLLPYSPFFCLYTLFRKLLKCSHSPHMHMSFHIEYFSIYFVDRRVSPPFRVRKILVLLKPFLHCLYRLFAWHPHKIGSWLEVSGVYPECTDCV